MRITQIRAEGKWAAGDCRADGKSSAMRHIYMPMAATAPLLPCAIAIASASARTQLLYLATPTPPLPMYSRRTYSSHHQRHNNQPAANSIYFPRSTATPPQLVADSRHRRSIGLRALSHEKHHEILEFLWLPTCLYIFRQQWIAPMHYAAIPM